MDAAPAGYPAGASGSRKVSHLVLTPEIRALVTRVLGTVTHLDVLLALRRDASRLCSPDELARAAGVPCGLVVRRCADDPDRAVLVASPGGASMCQYSPSTSTLCRTVYALAELYEARRRLVLRAFYLHPSVSFVKAAVQTLPASVSAARDARCGAKVPRGRSARGIQS